MAVTAEAVLVTGGAGFIGVNLARELAGRGFATRCYDSFVTGHRADAEAAGYSDIVAGDVLDSEGLQRAAEGCRFVVHLAAQAGVPSSVEDPVHDCDLNVRGTLNALLAARDAGVEGFVFASSIAPLGDVTPPAHEGLVPRPKSPYGASKLAGEAYCSAFASTYGVPTVALRFSNVYGPYSYHKGSAVASFCRAALHDRPIVIHGDGSQTRDFVFVGDLCAGIAAAMTSGAAGVVAHLGSGVPATVAEVARTVAARVGGNVRIENRSPRPGDVLHSSADISRAAALFDFAPRTELVEGIDRTVSWFEGSVS